MCRLQFPGLMDIPVMLFEVTKEFEGKEASHWQLILGWCVSWLVYYNFLQV